AARRSHYRGSHGMTRYSPALIILCLLASVICTLGVTGAWAQTQPDRERTNEAARQRNQQFPTQLPGTEQVTPFESPRELATDLPPMTAPQSDAAELLGTAYVPGEDAMFGEQLFQPGVAQVYGVGFNE